MMESFPPQVSLEGGFGDVVFEATAGTFDGDQTGCGGSRAVVSAGSTVTFNPPDSGVYTIRAAYASRHGQVSIASEMAVGAATSGCGTDTNSDGVIDVNDLLGVLSGFGSDGTDGSDVNADGIVDVNDLLGVLSDFGGTPSCTSVSEPAPAECTGCCPRGAACFAPDPPCCAQQASSCAQGADCGGQVWTDCGTSCPYICGSPPPQMCNAMCNAEYQCPGAMCFDEATGTCQEEGSTLPPGIAPGRPFLNAKLAPETATPYSVVSDWSTTEL